MSRIPKRPHKGHVISEMPLNTVQETENEELEDSAPFSLSKRRHSLGFTLAKIDAPSNIPLPPSVESKNPNINLLHINKLIGYNQTLNRQKMVASSRSYIKKSDDLIDNEVQYQIDALEDLDKSIDRLVTKADNLEVDIVELKRSNKKLAHKISDMKSHIASNRRKFDYVEDSVTKNVLNKEKLVNIQLDELSNKLTTQLSEIKFQLYNEVETAKQYKETDDKEIEELTLQRKQLEKELAEENLKVISKVKEQTAVLENDLVKRLDEQMQKSDKLMKVYEQKQTDLENIVHEFNNLDDQVKLLESDILTVEQSIKDIESEADSFGSTKAKLMNQLADLETTFSDINKENVKIDSQLALVNEKYETTRSKIRKQDQLRQVLENSIMEYQGSKRAVVNCDNSLDVHENKIDCDGLLVAFSKCFANLSGSDLIDEFSLFAYPSLQNKNSHIIFMGHPRELLLVDTIFRIYSTLQEKSEGLQKKGWRFATSLRGLEIHNTFHDIIDSKRDLGQKFTHILDVASQTMLIDEASDLNVVKTIDTSVPRVYIMRLDFSDENSTEKRTNFVSFFDLTSLSTTEQDALLSVINANTETTLLEQVLFSLRKERCLFLCQASQSNKILLPKLAQLYTS